MEKMPFRPEMDVTQVMETPMVHMSTANTSTPSEVISSNWQQQLPTLKGQQVTLRELRMSDAPSVSRRFSR